jgi:hypothetical protein
VVPLSIATEVRKIVLIRSGPNPTDPYTSDIIGERYAFWTALQYELTCTLLSEWHCFCSKWLETLDEAGELLRSNGKRAASSLGGRVTQMVFAFALTVHFNVDRRVTGNSQLNSINLGRWPKVATAYS